MKTLDELYQDLEKYKNFDVEKNIEYFLKKIDEIILLKKEMSIPLLIENIKEKSEYSWINDILQNNVLYFYKNNGSELFMQNIKKFITSAPIICEDTVSILFNSPESLTLFRTHMHLADRDSLLKLFDLMEKESPHHAPLIQELRRELLKNP
jgi:hypothetical protein